MMETQHTQQAVIPYLILPEAHNFFDFVKNVFNGSETSRFLNDDQSLMHGEVNISGSTIMFGNAGDSWKPQPAGLFIYVENADESFKKALDNGATVIMELENKDYGRTGGVQDPFGNTWWITAKTS